MQIRQNVCRTDSIWFLCANARRVAIPCRGSCSTEGFETPLTCRPHKPGMWKDFACGVCWPAQVIGDGVVVNRLYVVTLQCRDSTVVHIPLSLAFCDTFLVQRGHSGCCPESYQSSHHLTINKSYSESKLLN